MHKATKETNLVKKKDRDEAAGNKCWIAPASHANLLGSDDSEEKISVMSKNVVRSSYFKHKTVEKILIDQSENPLVKESIAPHDNNIPDLDEIEVRATTEQGNATRSSCFQHSSVNKYEKLKLDGGITTDRDEYASPGISSNNFLEELRKKRKVTSVDNTHTVSSHTLNSDVTLYSMDLSIRSLGFLF